MQLLFSPAIGEAVKIPVSDARVASDNLVLKFEASLGAEDYKRVKEGGVRVQLWSNLPSGNDHTSGRWGELDFQVAEEQLLTIAQPLCDRSAANAAYRVNLVGNDQERRPASVERLVLSVPVGLAAFSGGRRYGFTYRVLYSDGGVVWLGSHGRDGSIVLTGTAIVGAELGEGWSPVGPGGHGLVRRLDSSDIEGQAIAKVPSLGDHQVWAFDKSLCLRSSTSGFVPNAQLFIAVPRRQRSQHYDAPAYVLSATQGAYMSASPSTGVISGVGTGDVLFQTCSDPRLLPILFQAALAHGGVGEQVGLSVSEDENGWLLLLSPRSQSPTKGVLIPTNRANTQANIALDVARLAGIVTSPLKEGTAPEFCVFSPSTFDYEYIDTKRSAESPVEEHNDVVFSVPSSGGEFTLSRVYDLAGKDGPACKVSVLSSHGSASVIHTVKAVPVVLPTPLPTPPPSPQLQHRSSHRRSPTVTFVPEPIIIPSVDSSDDGELTHLNANGSSSHAGGEAPSASREVISVSRSAPLRRRGIIGLVRYFFSVFTFYGGALFYLIMLGPLISRLRRAPSMVENDRAALERTDVGPSEAPTLTEGNGDGESPEWDEEDDVTVTGDDTNGHGDLVDDEDKPRGNTPDAVVPLESPIPVVPQVESDPFPTDLFSADLYPNLDEQANGKVLVKVALITPNSGREVDSTVSGKGLLSSLGKAITLDGNDVEDVAETNLKVGDAKRGQVRYDYHLIEFPISSDSTNVAMKVKGL
ncbi:hypothetical protein DFP72DRAFT_10531 [Ephemerocybe angulata]|uniref:Uncharacterized protein n=1 Tax=Ephemerocybe angulata TaxID=980116 RepID=A0A8H6IIS4_9AGAR|nr:hypothetical protein DFP72DRAFT_10531 [Tulosesus angulatus]